MNKDLNLEFRCPDPCGALLCKYEDLENPYAIEIKCQRRGCPNVSIRSNCVPTNLVELRCQHVDVKKSERWGVPTVCNKLLGKIIPGSSTEIKCPRCKNLTISSDQFPDLLPKETYE